jgi:hypothetical protein
MKDKPLQNQNSGLRHRGILTNSNGAPIGFIRTVPVVAPKLTQSGKPAASKPGQDSPLTT